MFIPINFPSELRNDVILSFSLVLFLHMRFLRTKGFFPRGLPPSRIAAAVITHSKHTLHERNTSASTGLSPSRLHSLSNEHYLEDKCQLLLTKCPNINNSASLSGGWVGHISLWCDKIFQSVLQKSTFQFSPGARKLEGFRKMLDSFLLLLVLHKASFQNIWNIVTEFRARVAKLFGKQ